MSQSPLSDVSAEGDAVESYLNNWNALANLIRQGRSLSGRERNCCFLNIGPQASQAGFVDVSSAVGLDLIDDGRGLAIVDWDHDGDLDLWFANRTGPRVRIMLNDLAAQDDSISLVLQGTDCNRDAIGARIELMLAGDNRTRVQTLRAGEGFLSQSTKTIHFGIGERKTVKGVRVRWPGFAEPQEFVGLRAGARYRLVQGRDQAEQLPARKPVRLEDGELQPPKPASAARIVLTQRRSVSQLGWRSYDGTERALAPSGGRGTLVSLWASWCKPCLSELEQLTRHAETLQSQGLNVVLLSVDSEVDDARRISNRLNLPFTVGMATQETLRKLTQLDRDVFYRFRPLPLPSSLLVDAQGRVAAIYKGSVEPEQLLADLESLDGPVLSMVQSALPFSGRNIAAWFSPDPVNVARAYLEGGYTDDALGELQRFLRQPVSATDRVRALQLLANVARTRSDTELQTEALRQLLAQQPENPQVQLQLVTVLHHARQTDEAQALLKKLEQTAESHPGLLVPIGQFYMRIGAAGKAIERLERAVAADAESAEPRINLAIARQLNGETAAAIEQYHELLHTHPERLDAVNNLAWLLANDPTTVDRREEAVELARRVCRETNQSRPAFLDTLGVALAQAGELEAAREVLQRAIPLARSRGETALADKMSQRLLEWSGSEERLP